MDNANHNIFTSSSTDVSEFLRSTIWRDFSAIAIARLRVISDSFPTVASMEDLRYLVGEKVGIEFWLKFPEAIKAQLYEAEQTVLEKNHE